MKAISKETTMSGHMWTNVCVSKTQVDVYMPTVTQITVSKWGENAFNIFSYLSDFNPEKEQNATLAETSSRGVLKAQYAKLH